MKNKSLFLIILGIVFTVSAFLWVIILKGNSGKQTETASQNTALSPNRPPTVSLSPQEIEIYRNLKTEFVAIKNQQFLPQTVQIKINDQMEWQNKDKVDHRIKTNTWEGPLIRPGSNFSYTFKETGTFDYWCSLHPEMKGKVTILP